MSGESILSGKITNLSEIKKKDGWVQGDWLHRQLTIDTEGTTTLAIFSKEDMYLNGFKVGDTVEYTKKSARGGTFNVSLKTVNGDDKYFEPNTLGVDRSLSIISQSCLQRSVDMMTIRYPKGNSELTVKDITDVAEELTDWVVKNSKL